jgi:protein-S-isoprenylcysteine O-methyltransferase Ste14
MEYVLIGAIGFLLASAFDWLSLKYIPILKQAVGVLAVCLMIYATVMVCMSSPRFDLPFFTIPLGSCLLLLSLALLIYSLFIEIPFHSTYVGKGVGPRLITTGTYALVRHPGVLWLALVYVSLALLFPSATLFIAVAIWFILDFIYVVIEDRIFFPRMFPDYPDYRRRTPFLIPSKQSILSCIKTINPGNKARK